MVEPVIWSEDVRPEWIDYNGHLSEPFYVLVFGHGTDAVMAAIGMTPEYLTATGTSLYTVEAHVRYLDQVPPDSGLEVRSWVIGVSGKLLWLWHEMYRVGCGPARRSSACTWTAGPAGPARFPPSCGPGPRRCWCRRPSTRPAGSP